MRSATWPQMRTLKGPTECNKSKLVMRCHKCESQFSQDTVGFTICRGVCFFVKRMYHGKSPSSHYLGCCFSLPLRNVLCKFKVRFVWLFSGEWSRIALRHVFDTYKSSNYPIQNSFSETPKNQSHFTTIQSFQVASILPKKDSVSSCSPNTKASNFSYQREKTVWHLSQARRNNNNKQQQMLHPQV